MRGLKCIGSNQQLLATSDTLELELHLAAIGNASDALELPAWSVFRFAIARSIETQRLQVFGRRSARWAI